MAITSVSGNAGFAVPSLAVSTAFGVSGAVPTTQFVSTQNPGASLLSLVAGGRNASLQSTRDAQSVEADVRRIITEQLDVNADDIKLTSAFATDLGADSLGLVELVLAFEEKFEIDIPDEEVENIKTVQDAINYVMTH